jgi:hypothetical protein
MPGKFERECYFVEQLARPLGWAADVAYRDPLVDHGYETGVDVVTLMRDRRVGIQVSEYDGGEGSPSLGGGRMRAHEKELVREAGAMGVYVGWGSPYFERAFRARIAAKAERSLRYTFAEFHEVWLLVPANIPGAGISTFVPSRHINAAMLEQVSGEELRSSRYTFAFLHIIMGDVLYVWDRTTGWKELIDRRQKRTGRGH